MLYYISIDIEVQEVIMNIDNKKIYNAYLFGAKKVMDQKNYLNKINVFPVADGDTGSNLSSMMNAIIRETQEKENVKETFESIADAALGGARGNSGIIFAEYLNGVSIELNHEAVLSVENFASANHSAVKYAYNAINNPVEGTMITVIKEWANALVEFANKATNVVELLTLSNERLEESVVQTQYQLDSLKKASVVDSGAKGFAYFIGGILEFLKSGKTELEDEITNLRIDLAEVEEPLHVHTELTHRYCTEAIFNGNETNLSVVKERLTSLGDSLIVAGNDRIKRVHIHTDDPAKVFEILKEEANITYQKVDDMLLQNEIVENRRSSIAIVTDSIADLPKSFVDEHQIQVIHLSLLFEDVSYLDKLTIQTKKILEYSKNKSLPTSSQPDTQQLENKFQYLQTYYDKIIVLTVSKSLSGTHNVVNKVASKLSTKEKPITVLNTKQNSGAEGLLVMECARLLDQGTSYDDIITTMNTHIANSKIFVCIKTLENMIKSGRLSIKAGKIAKLIGMKPIITLDEEGKGGLSTIAFSFESSQKKLIKHVNKILKTRKIKSYSLVHVDNLDEAVIFSQRMESIIGFKPEYIEETSAIVAVGAGQGAIGFSYILEE